LVKFLSWTDTTDTVCVLLYMMMSRDKDWA
jgi:hypothetical protein